MKLSSRPVLVLLSVCVDYHFNAAHFENLCFCSPSQVTMKGREGGWIELLASLRKRRDPSVWDCGWAQSQVRLVLFDRFISSQSTELRQSCQEPAGIKDRLISSVKLRDRNKQWKIPFHLYSPSQCAGFVTITCCLRALPQQRLSPAV